MAVEILDRHYIRHATTGLPVRIPPHLKRDLYVGAPSGVLYAEAIAANPFVRKRGRVLEDTVPHNFAENARLRRIARVASRKLVEKAQTLGEERYCTTVNGSVAMGLVRQPTSDNPSDIDIHLVLGSSETPKATRVIMQEDMNREAQSLGAKVDAHVFTLDELKRGIGHFARNYLESAAYPIANVGNLWEEVVAIGLQCEHFSRFGQTKKREIKTALQLLAEGDEDGLLVFLLAVPNPLWRNGILNFLVQHNVFDNGQIQQNAREMYELFSS